MKKIEDSNNGIFLSNQKGEILIRGTKEDLKELAIASIKQEYEFWLNERKNVSARTDEMLQKILNGHFLSKSEEFEMVCDDSKKLNFILNMNL